MPEWKNRSGLGWSPTRSNRKFICLYVGDDRDYYSVDGVMVQAKTPSIAGTILKPEIWKSEKLRCLFPRCQKCLPLNISKILWHSADDYTGPATDLLLEAAPEHALFPFIPSMIWQMVTSVAIGWAGDIWQASNHAKEAKNGVNVSSRFQRRGDGVL